MRTLIAALIVTSPLLLSAGVAGAKGCLKGAAVGGVVGHVAGHHAVVGAAAGCVIEHHREKQEQKAAQQEAANRAAGQNRPGAAGSPGTPPSLIPARGVGGVC
jgi:hypothetical protein